MATSSDNLDRQPSLLAPFAKIMHLSIADEIYRCNIRFLTFFSANVSISPHKD